MSYVYCQDFAIDLLDRADALVSTDMFLSRSDLDRSAYQRMYAVIDMYVQEDEEYGIDSVIIDDFDALLTEWESLLLEAEGIDPVDFYVSFYDEVCA